MAVKIQKTLANVKGGDQLCPEVMEQDRQDKAQELVAEGRQTRQAWGKVAEETTDRSRQAPEAVAFVQSVAKKPHTCKDSHAIKYNALSAALL